MDQVLQGKQIQFYRSVKYIFVNTSLLSLTYLYINLFCNGLNISNTALKIETELFEIINVYAFFIEQM